MPTLSVAMIVKNEEAHLAHCLASIRDLADEIVVVDTGSSDRTVEIAQGFGAKLGHFAWNDDFSAARNESLRLCSGDWVLVLDADEAVDRLDHPVLRGLMEKGEHAAWYVLLRTYFTDGTQASLDVAVVRNQSAYTEGKDLPYYAEAPGLRFFRRLDGVHFKGTIHELAAPFFEEQGLEIVRSPVVVHHYGKLDAQREKGKMAFYLRLAEDDAAREPANHQFQFNVMMQAMVAEQWEKVLSAAESYIRLRGDAPYLVLVGAGLALKTLGRPAEALHYFDLLIQAVPDHAVGLTYRAQCLAAVGRIPEARENLEKAIARNPGFVVPYVNLAELEGQAGTYEAARDALLRGIRENPGQETLFRSMVQLDLAHGRTEQATADAWEALQILPSSGRGDWHRLVAVSLLMRGQKEAARTVIALGLGAFPAHEGLARLESLAKG